MEYNAEMTHTNSIRVLTPVASTESQPLTIPIVNNHVSVTSVIRENNEDLVT